MLDKAVTKKLSLFRETTTFFPEKADVLVVIDNDHIILSTMLLAGEKVERLSQNLVFMALSEEQRLLYFQNRTAM